MSNKISSSKKEIAEALGIGNASLSQYYNNVVDVPESVILVLCYRYSFSKKWFAGSSDEMLIATNKISEEFLRISNACQNITKDQEMQIAPMISVIKNILKIK